MNRFENMNRRRSTGETKTRKKCLNLGQYHAHAVRFQKKPGRRKEKSQGLGVEDFDRLGNAVRVVPWISGHHEPPLGNLRLAEGMARPKLQQIKSRRLGLAVFKNRTLAVICFLYQPRNFICLGHT